MDEHPILPVDLPPLIFGRVVGRDRLVIPLRHYCSAAKQENDGKEGLHGFGKTIKLETLTRTEQDGGQRQLPNHSEGQTGYRLPSANSENSYSPGAPGAILFVSRR